MPMPLLAGSSSQTIEDSERLLLPSSKTTILPHILLIVTQFFFSGWHLLGSLAMRGGANPLIFALYRESLATFLMFFYVLFQLKGKLETLRIDRDDIPRFVFVGFCCFVNVVGTVVSLQYISPDKYAILQPAIPVIATVISCCVKLENFTILKVLGICIASLGAILIESESISEVEDDFDFDFSFVLEACCLYL
jgi:drug/metabolite transporter (DMT)-like permease